MSAMDTTFGESELFWDRAGRHTARLTAYGLVSGEFSCHDSLSITALAVVPQVQLLTPAILGRQPERRQLVGLSASNSGKFAVQHECAEATSRQTVP